MNGRLPLKRSRTPTTALNMLYSLSNDVSRSTVLYPQQWLFLCRRRITPCRPHFDGFGVPYKSGALGG